MRSVQSLIASMCLLSLAPCAFGQSPQSAPAPPSATNSAPGFRWNENALVRPYRQKTIDGIRLRNSNRAEQLLRGGVLYLSLQDAIALALENNIDIEVSRYGPKLADADLLRAEAGGVIRGVQTNVTNGAQSATNFVTGGFGGGTGGTGTGGGATGGAQSGTVFQVTGTQIPNLDPQLSLSYARSKSSSPQTNSFASGLTGLVTDVHAYNFNLSKQWLSGTGLQFGWQQNHIATNSPNNDLNPFYRGNFNLQLQQRLLQGFGMAVNNRNIRISKNNLKVSDLTFKQQVITTVQSTVNLYLDLVSFNEALKVRRQAVALAQKLYEDNKKQVEIGTLAPIEVVRAEAQLAQTQTDLTVQETQVLQQETILKNQLSRTGLNSPTFKDARIIPTDSFRPPASEQPPNLEELVAAAIAKRPDVEQTRIQIENTRIGLNGAKNQLLPSFDVFASATNNGLAGQRNVLLPPGRPGPDAFFIGGIGDFYGQLFRRNFPDYSVGFQLNVPLRNRAAQADIANDTLRLRQQELQGQRLENSIRVDVQNAVIAVQQALANFRSAEKTRQLQEQTLDAEQKKFALGSSTIFVVVQTQRDLVLAQSNEVSAINSYYRAKNQLDVAVGRLLETNNVEMMEASSGDVKRAPSALPPAN